MTKAILILAFQILSPIMFHRTPTAAGFGWRISVTVGTVTSGPHTDFPLLVATTNADLKVAGSGGKVQNASGYDIGFYSNSDCSTGKLKWKTLRWISTTGEVIYRVKVSSLNTSSVVYMCFGDAAITTDQSDGPNTFETAFKAFYPLEDGTTLSALDATSNGYDGTISTPTAIAGKVGGAASFNGTSDKITTSDPTLATSGSAFTVSGWVNVTDFTPDQFPTILRLKSDAGTDDWRIFASNQGGYEGVAIGSNSQWARRYTQATLSTGAWHHFAATYNGSGASTGTNFAIYVDGSSISLGNAGAYGGFANTMALGDGDSCGVCFLKGGLDEVRVVAAERSAGYIATEYANENNPATFLTFGSTTAN